MEKFELKKTSPAAITKTGNTPKTTKNAAIDFSRGFCFVSVSVILNILMSENIILVFVIFRCNAFYASAANTVSKSFVNLTSFLFGDS
ncbi:hypothetical protein VQ270_000530 [Salmonella enterica]|nr:hypothetical protein [Salmonella enterica]EJJ4348714.1 hypothetical protein [Salmonella enterica]EJJ4353179.1 hypothetical protein [Salmonella enterica]EJJ4424763.1 hypothetical protein [Salmonella enterica]EJJ4456013.1 hypothetical protein [Salmonella enterica]